LHRQPFVSEHQYRQYVYTYIRICMYICVYICMDAYMYTLIPLCTNARMSLLILCPDGHGISPAAVIYAVCRGQGSAPPCAIARWEMEAK